MGTYAKFECARTIEMVVHADAISLTQHEVETEAMVGNKPTANDFVCDALNSDGLQTDVCPFMPHEVAQAMVSGSYAARFGRDFDCMEWRKPVRSLSDSLKYNSK